MAVVKLHEVVYESLNYSLAASLILFKLATNHPLILDPPFKLPQP